MAFRYRYQQSCQTGKSSTTRRSQGQHGG
jgi:hypothetical protein